MSENISVSWCSSCLPLVALFSRFDTNILYIPKLGESNSYNYACQEREKKIHGSDYVVPIRTCDAKRNFFIKRIFSNNSLLHEAHACISNLLQYYSTACMNNTNCSGMFDHTHT